MSLTLNGTSGITYNNASTSSVGGIGDGQTWQNLLASRAYGTTYTNSSGKPIMVVTYGSGANQNQPVVVNGVTIGQTYIGSYTNGGTWFIVPNGGTYSVAATGASLVNWAELR